MLLLLHLKYRYVKIHKSATDDGPFPLLTFSYYDTEGNPIVLMCILGSNKPNTLKRDPISLLSTNCLNDARICMAFSSVTEGWNDGSAYKGTRNSVKDMLIESGPFFGAGPVVPDSEREFYVTQINYQRVLKRFKFHIERWKSDNPSHPMAKKENWSDDEKEKWIRWYHLSGQKFTKKD